MPATGSTHPIGDTRRDVATPTDVEDIVRRFYRDVAQDDLLGPIFNDVAQVDWTAHIPRLTAFWCRFLFKQPGFDGDPHQRHLESHERAPFTPQHFWRWLELFHRTLDHAWAGRNVERMKLLARSVARVHCRNLTGIEIDFGLEPDARSTLGQSPPR